MYAHTHTHSHTRARAHTHKHTHTNIRVHGPAHIGGICQSSEIFDRNVSVMGAREMHESRGLGGNPLTAVYDSALEIASAIFTPLKFECAREYKGGTAGRGRGSNDKALSHISLIRSRTPRLSGIVHCDNPLADDEQEMVALLAVATSGYQEPADRCELLVALKSHNRVLDGGASAETTWVRVRQSDDMIVLLAPRTVHLQYTWGGRGTKTARQINLHMVGSAMGAPETVSRSDEQLQELARLYSTVEAGCCCEDKPGGGTTVTFDGCRKCAVRVRYNPLLLAEPTAALHQMLQTPGFHHCQRASKRKRSKETVREVHDSRDDGPETLDSDSPEVHDDPEPPDSDSSEDSEWSNGGEGGSGAVGGVGRRGNSASQQKAAANRACEVRGDWLQRFESTSDQRRRTLLAFESDEHPAPSH